MSTYLISCYCRNQDNIFLFHCEISRQGFILNMFAFTLHINDFTSLTVTRTTSMPNFVPVNVCIRMKTSIRSAVVHSSVAFASRWTVVSSVTFQVVLNACSGTMGLLSATVPLTYTCWKENNCIV